MPMDAEQEYAQMDYRICGELSKLSTSFKLIQSKLLYFLFIFS